MSSPQTTPHLPPELWLMIFTQMDDPVHVLTCRTVSRDFESHVKKYFKAHCVPTLITLCASSTDHRCISKLDGFRCQDGSFSHYSADGKTAHFALSEGSSSSEMKPKEGPMRLYLDAWSLEAYRRITGTMLPTTEGIMILPSRTLSPNQGMWRMRWRIDEHRKSAEFKWWEMCTMLVRAPRPRRIQTQGSMSLWRSDQVMQDSYEFWRRTSSRR
jgi:hypothetical protein